MVTVELKMSGTTQKAGEEMLPSQFTSFGEKGVRETGINKSLGRK